MIVWGGRDNENLFKEGGKYDPAKDVWQSLNLVTNPLSGREGHTAVWTGSHMIVWGGVLPSTPTVRFNDGASYNPLTDNWEGIPTLLSLEERSDHTAVWTGESVIVWDGEPITQTGGIFFPNTIPRAVSQASTSIGGDTLFVLGTGEEVSFDASSSTDGSNAFTNVPYHDFSDAVVKYEWDLNSDANLGSQCQRASTGIDRVGSTITLQEIDLQAVGIAIPGKHEVWLRVFDENLLAHCVSLEITVVDGVLPVVTLISPNGGESWPYSADSTNRQSNLIVWGASDNFGIADTKLSYTCNGLVFACIADTSGKECPAGALKAGDTSFQWLMPTQSEASSNGQNLPSPTCKISVEVLDASGNTAIDVSDSNFYIVQPVTTSIKTLIVWSSERMSAKHGEANADSLALKLTQLAGHKNVAGTILDLSNVPEIVSAYQAWDLNQTDQSLANAVATTVRNYLLIQLQTYSSSEFLILVGDDIQIPFYRMHDGATIYTESSYIFEVPFDTGSTAGSAVAQGFFLTDNFYSELAPEVSGLASPHDLVYLNDLFVGRLIETPAQMENLIDVFLAQNGQLNVLGSQNQVLVSGHDFLYDSALDIKNAFTAASKPTDCLLDDPTSDADTPCVDVSYSPLDLKVLLLSSPAHQLNNVNTHANHFNFATSTGLLSTLDMDSNSALMTGNILYTSGCHSGLNLASGPNDLDLPELMSKKGVIAYIGNTGYSWGLKYGTGLTESLMKNITSELLENSLISIGTVIAEAKRNYRLTETRYDVFDEKVLHELTLFGIPNYLIVTSAQGAQSETTFSASDGASNSCVAGICVSKSVRDVEVQAGSELPAANLLPPGVTELELNFLFGPQTYTLINTPDGQYYKLNGEATGETGDTLQPRFVYDSRLSGTVAHGVAFLGGGYKTVFPFNPVIAVPRSTNEDNGEGSIPGRRTIIPSIIVSGSGLSPSNLTAEVSTADADPGSSFVNMVISTGFFDSDTQFLFEDMQFVTYYSNSVDKTLPFFIDPEPEGFHTVSGSTAN
ncbi:MAG: C25 family cysteine peptidase, partial [Nitrososphaera sp.]|nr:C25 family cysteine peptidase [Nitrososphaera sp.]